MHVSIVFKEVIYIVALNGKYCRRLMGCGLLNPFWKLCRWACCLSS